jgi:hypothetical protein
MEITLESGSGNRNTVNKEKRSCESNCVKNNSNESLKARYIDSNLEAIEIKDNRGDPKGGTDWGIG